MCSICLSCLLLYALFFLVWSVHLVHSFDPSSSSLFPPLSIRAALLEKSKQLNPTQQYSLGGWSNRAAAVLTPIHLNPGVYTADRPFYWNNIDVGCRCTVIEMPPNPTGASNDSNKPDLWVHSPVAYDGPLKASLEKLGSVRHVMSPNYEHVSFASQWYQNVQRAQMWACPDLTNRMPEIGWTGEIPAGYRPVGWKGGDGTFLGNNPLPWDVSILQPLHIDCEMNPFTGRPFFNEVIFYHKPTKTLLTTDLYWNYPADSIPNSQYGRDDSWELAPPVGSVPLGSRLWKLGMDKIYGPFYNSFMVTDKTKYQDIADHILNVWEVETVIPAHGDILRGRQFISDVLKKHFRFE